MERGTHANAEQVRGVQITHAHDECDMSALSSAVDLHTHGASARDQQHARSPSGSSTSSITGNRKRRIPTKLQDSQQTYTKTARTTTPTINTTTMYVSETPCNPGQPTTLWGTPFRRFSYHIRDVFIRHTRITVNNLQGTRALWTEWITPNTYKSSVQTLGCHDSDITVYLCTTMSIIPTDPSGYCPRRAGAVKARSKTMLTFELRRLKQTIDPRVTITLQRISRNKTQAARLQGICFAVKRKPQDTTVLVTRDSDNRKQTVFNEYKSIGTDDNGREHSFTSVDTFLLDKPIKLSPIRGTRAHWEPPSADMTKAIEIIQHRQPALSDICVRINPAIAIDKALKAGKDLITAVGLQWANIPPLQTILSVVEEALRAHGPEFNAAEDVQNMLRALHQKDTDATLPKWARRPQYHYTFLFYVWTLRPTDAELDHLVRHIEAARRSTMLLDNRFYTQNDLANDLRAYVGKLDPKTDLSWPNLAKLSTMNPKAVSDWDPNAVDDLSKELRRLHEAAKAHRQQHKSFKLTEKGRLSLLQKIYAIKGLGGTYLSEHLIAAFLHIFRIGYADRSFLVMGSGSGAPKYAFFRFYGIKNTDDLLKALHAFNKQNPIDKKWVTPRMVAFTLCVAGIFNDFLSGKSDVITL